MRKLISNDKLWGSVCDVIIPNLCVLFTDMIMISSDRLSTVAARGQLICDFDMADSESDTQRERGILFSVIS